MSLPPRATYRLQIGPNFDLNAVRGVLPYLKALGVSHVYASPLLATRAETDHGYDVVDPTRIDEAIGGEAAFAALCTELQGLGLGLILDIVPNHMGIGRENPWWLDVLEHGRASAYGRFFDIDWTRRPDGKIVLPILGDAYGRVLEQGEIKLEFAPRRGRFRLRYYDHVLPVAGAGYAELLRRAESRLDPAPAELGEIAGGFASTVVAEPGAGASPDLAVAGLRARLAALLESEPAAARAIEDVVVELNGPDGPDPRAALHRLLESQNYRLAHWRVSGDEINYRRFFEIDDLAAVRVEDPAVFVATHGRLLQSVARGEVQGLRIDHIDGLADPLAYLRALPDGIYLVVEKILGPGEALPADWPVAGTTGYEFMNDVLGLFVDSSAEAAFTDGYVDYTGRTGDFAELARTAKLERVALDFAGETDALAARLYDLAERDLVTRDITRNALRRALAALTAELDVYRTYVTAAGPSETDRARLHAAADAARAWLDPAARRAVDFVESVFGFAPEATVWAAGGELLELVQRWQQLTGPVMAKAVEDTSFYRYHRFVALNEVGGEPGHFGLAPEALHARLAERARRRPHGMVATATHDHKRGEDLRARLAVLSEMLDGWRAVVARFDRALAPLRADADPGPDARYLLYQMVVGAWPLDLAADDRGGLDDLAERLAAYMLKASREAKERTAWTDVDEAYEATLDAFVRGALSADRTRAFPVAVAELVERIAPTGAVNGLAQTLIRLAAPGVPDTYQGTEFWDFSLVDPDNRRPVDYAARASALAEDSPPADLLADWRDGRIKLRLLSRVLAERERLPALFADGAYLPLHVSGPAAAHVFAFARRHGDELAIAVVPRLVLDRLDGSGCPRLRADAFADETVALPDGPASTLRDVLTGRRFDPTAQLLLSELLQDWPVAFLVRE
jgi:(1->4)-alpha-D-glucan 1-alpha-D-glucosylmutase